MFQNIHSCFSSYFFYLPCQNVVYLLFQYFLFTIIAFINIFELFYFYILILANLYVLSFLLVCINFYLAFVYFSFSNFSTST